MKVLLNNKKESIKNFTNYFLTNSR